MSNVECWHPIWHDFLKIYKGSQIGAKLDAKFGVLAPIHNLTPHISTIFGTILASHSVWVMNKWTIIVNFIIINNFCIR